MINQYPIYKFNYKYIEINVKDYSFLDFIQRDFAKFEARYFDKFNNLTWRVVKDYHYKFEFWINHNLELGRSRTIVILQAIAAK